MTSKKTNLKRKKIKFDCVWNLIFLITYAILIVEVIYMPLDAILPLLDVGRRYLYQILLKKAFVDHEIDFFNSIALGRTLLIGFYTQLFVRHVMIYRLYIMSNDLLLWIVVM